MRTAVLALGALACLGAPAQAEIASYYGKELAGQRTASGERFNPIAMTAAHRTLRFGTRVRVTNSRNGRSVVVRINDRGPFVKRRRCHGGLWLPPRFCFSPEYLHADVS